MSYSPQTYPTRIAVCNASAQRLYDWLVTLPEPGICPGNYEPEYRRAVLIGETKLLLEMQRRHELLTEYPTPYRIPPHRHAIPASRPTPTHQFGPSARLHELAALAWVA